MRGRAKCALMCVLLLEPFVDAVAQEEPPAINPFGTRRRVREDAVPGYIETSDGKIFPGRIYLTRDARFRIYDEQLKRHRDVPLRVVKKIEATVQKEWMEKEWRFREAADWTKVYTGRSYPSRIYVHTIELKDGRKLTGPLSALVYLQPGEGGRSKKFILHKRQKGEVGKSLDELIYVKRIVLGEDALAEAKRKLAEQVRAEAKAKRRGKSERRESE